MIGRIGPVTSVVARPASVGDARVYRTDRIPTAQTGGIAVYAAAARPARHGRRDARAAAPGSTRRPRATRRWCSARPPPERLGIGRGRPGRPGLARRRAGSPWSASSTRCRSRRSWTRRRSSAGRRPTTYLGFDGHPTTVYTRSRGAPGRGGPRGARPRPPTRRRPNEVKVSRPSDALAAQQADRRGVHRPAARPGRGGAAGRRRRRGQHDGDLGAGTARRDRPAPLARRHPGPDPDPVPGRVAAAVGARRASAGCCSASWSPPATPSGGTGRPWCRSGRWPAASGRPW